jgi:hypothetical protein
MAEPTGTGAQMRAAIAATNSALHDENGAWLVRAALWYGYMDDSEPGANDKHFGARWRKGGGTKAETWSPLSGLSGGRERAPQ